MKLIAIALCLAFAASALAAGLTDSIVCDGEIVGDVVGGHDMRRPARIIPVGGEASLELRVTPNEPLTIEIEEMYGRDTDVRGYVVYVDDAKTFLRTSRGCGAGPLHYFIDAPAPKKDRVTLRLVNAAACPFAVSRIWAFADFDRYFDASGMSVPFYIAPASRLTFKDFDRDLAAVRQIRDSLGEHPNVKPAFTTWIAYATWCDAEVARQLDYILRLAEAADMPVQIGLDTWWGDTPAVADGCGGFFTDVQYQQVVYNATTKQMQLSTPNRWASVPWLTTNHPDLNGYKTRRLAAAGKLIGAHEKRNRILAINLDNEPVYWASGNAGLGMELLQADFNRHTIAAAKRDGVAVDPVDGLSVEERRWLWRNLLNYNQLIADTLASVAGPLRDEIYTQAMVADPALQYPLFDGSRPFWESAAPSSVRVGGEWNSDSLPEQEAVLHQIALGRNAAVNAECSDDERNMQGVAPAYALGQRFYAPYNYPLDKINVATAQLRDVSRPFETWMYQPVLLEHDFTGDAWKKIVAEQKDVAVGRLGNSPAQAVHCTASSKVGSLTYRVRAPQETFDGLCVELSGRAFDFAKTNDDVRIRVLAGDRELGEIRGKLDINAVHRIDLTEASRGKKEIDVRIELHPAGIGQLQWCSLHRVRFTTPWPAEMTRDLPPQLASFAATRKRNLLVSWRRDAELVMQSDDAKKLYAGGEYAKSFSLSHQGSREAGGGRAGVRANVDAPSKPTTITGTFRPRLHGFPAILSDDATGAVPIHNFAAVGTSARSGDQAEATLDADGNVTAFTANSVEQESVIAQFTQLTPYDMPTIRLRGESDARIIDLVATLHLPGGNTTFRKSALGSIKLAAGDKVKIRFNPKSGRVFELWQE